MECVFQESIGGKEWDLTIGIVMCLIAISVDLKGTKVHDGPTSWWEQCTLA